MALAAGGWDGCWIALGWVAQAAFFLRFLIQWIASEKRGESVVPVVFWWLSLSGAVLYLAYSIWLESPPLVVLFTVNTCIYLRNLTYLRPEARLLPPSAILPLILGVAVLVLAALIWRLDWSEPTAWLVLGFVGQIVWNSRFVIQWVASERRGSSVLPEAFWWVSLVGDAILLAYAVHRVDFHLVDGRLVFRTKELVLVAAFLFNGVPYIRNLVLIRRKGRAAAQAALAGVEGSDRPV